MKQLLFLVFIFTFYTAFSQNSNVVIGTIDSVYSKVLNEKRKVWVYVPDSDPNSLYGKQKYPVVYLLDGDAHFYSVVGMIHQLSMINGNSICPQMIVVGIPNTDRTRDLTPTHAVSSAFMGADALRNSGGGENFTTFIEKELIPHIDSNYSTAPYRMLIGHSFGGLLAVNTLINHPKLFNSYIAIDPSLWWDDQKLLKQSKAVLGQQKFNSHTLYLSIANTMGPGMDTVTVKNDTSGGTSHIRSILQFAKLLQNNTGNGLNWSYKYYPEDNHGSVPLISEYDALHFIFRDYKFPQFPRLLDSTFNIDSAVRAHYRKLSDEMGYNVLPPEPLINQMGYNYLQSKMYSTAYKFFKMNIDNYPQSFNVYDSMGDLYLAKGDRDKAIEYFTKALERREYPDTRQKLERLKSGK